MAAGRPAAPTAGRPSLCPRPASARGSRPVVKASARPGVAAPNPVGSAPRAGEQGQCTLNRSPSGGPERASLFVPRAWRPSPSPVPPPSPAGTSQPREGGGLGPPRGCIWSQVPITSSGPAGGRTEGRHGFQNASGLSDAASSRVRRGRRRGTSYQTRRRRRLGHARPVVGTRRRGQALRPGGRLAEGSSRVRSPGPGSSRAGTSRCRR